MLEALLWGLVATSSLVIGALVVQLRCPSERVLGVVMAFGAGVLISAVSFELIEEAVEVSGGHGGTALGFLTGAAVFTLGDLAISSLGYRNRKDIAGGAQEAPAYAIVLGTILDGVPESAVLGLTVLQTGEVGAAILVAIFVSNLPESIAASFESSGERMEAAERDAAVDRHRLRVFAVSSGRLCAARRRIAEHDGVHVRLRRRRDPLHACATSMMPEAYEHTRRWAGMFTVLGFGVAFLVNWAAA